MMVYLMILYVCIWGNEKARWVCIGCCLHESCKCAYEKEGGVSVEHTWLPADLPQRIIRIVPRQLDLLLVREVKVVNAADERGDALAREGFGERGDEGGFSDALEAVEADDEGWRRRWVIVIVGF